VKNLANHNKARDDNDILRGTRNGGSILNLPNHRRKAACTRSCPTRKYTHEVI